MWNLARVSGLQRSGMRADKIERRVDQAKEIVDWIGHGEEFP